MSNWTPEDLENVSRYGACHICGQPRKTYFSSHTENDKTVWEHYTDCPNFHWHPERASDDHERRPTPSDMPR